MVALIFYKYKADGFLEGGVGGLAQNFEFQYFCRGFQKS